MLPKVIIFICLILPVHCFINRFLITIKTMRFDQNKTPLIIYDSESKKVISNIIAQLNNKSHNNGNETSVLINPNPRIPISPSFKSLCKMNFIQVV